MRKEIHIEEVGNAYKMQLLSVEDGMQQERGKPVVVLDTASDEALGQSVRNLLRTRIRTARLKAAEVGA
jgi:hypothetical protein